MCWTAFEDNKGERMIQRRQTYRIRIQAGLFLLAPLPLACTSEITLPAANQGAVSTYPGGQYTALPTVVFTSGGAGAVPVQCLLTVNSGCLESQLVSAGHAAFKSACESLAPAPGVFAASACARNGIVGRCSVNKVELGGAGIIYFTGSLANAQSTCQFLSGSFSPG